MNYYTVTNYIDHDQLRTAGGKGRDDYFEVLRRTGLEPIVIPTVKSALRIPVTERFSLEQKLRNVWRSALSGLGEGDVLVLHSPVSEKFLGITTIIEEVCERGCKIIDIVFDLETFFKSDYSRFAGFKQTADRLTEAGLFELSDVIICHNDKMKDKIVSLGVAPEKIVCVGVMDYLRDGYEVKDPERFGRKGPVVFCGNLGENKSGFVYDICEVTNPGLDLELYGPGYTGREQYTTTRGSIVTYRGTYTAFELMDKMEGSFGLVWDGPSVHTCEGACGEYLSYNNPHKMSHYLASGMPVLVWEDAAMADFVTRQGCGLTIRELGDIPGLIRSLTDEQYAELRRNAERVGADMRKGMHIRFAVIAAFSKLGEN